MAKVLLIDDDVSLAEILKRALEKEQWTVEMAHNGKDGLQLLENFKYDLVLLDWQMPDMNGLEVLQRFRSSGGVTTVIFLTGLGDVDHKEIGLDAGADDYLAKPFDTRELFARIRALQRRSTGAMQKDLTANGITLNTKARTLKYQDKEIKLSSAEASILEFFYRHPNQLYNSPQVFEHVWPSESEAKADTVRVHLHVLRRKLSLAEMPELVKTVKGSGYILETS